MSGEGIDALLLGIEERLGAEHARYRLRVEAKGDQLTCYINGEPVCRVQDNTFTIGQVGLVTFKTAARFSFLLSIPAIVLSGLFELSKELGSGSGNAGWGAIIVATIVSFVVGYAAIAFLLKWLTRHTLYIFVVYRVVVGLLILVLAQQPLRLLQDRALPAQVGHVYAKTVNPLWLCRFISQALRDESTGVTPLAQDAAR